MSHVTRVGILHTRCCFRLDHLFGGVPCFSRGIRVSRCPSVPGGRFAHSRVLDVLTGRVLSTTRLLPTSRSRMKHVRGCVTLTCTTGVGLCRTCRRSRAARTMASVGGRLLERIISLYSRIATDGHCNLLSSFRKLSLMTGRGNGRSIFTVRCSVGSNARDTNHVG